MLVAIALVGGNGAARGIALKRTGGGVAPARQGVARIAPKGAIAGFGWV